MRSFSRLRAQLVVLAVFASPVLLVGCAGLQQRIDAALDDWDARKQERLDQVDQAKAAVTDQIGTAQTTVQQAQEALKAQPPGEARDATLKALEKSNQLIAELQARLPALDALRRSIEQDSPTPDLLQQLTALPVVGPYASVITLIGGYAFREALKRRRAAREAEVLSAHNDELVKATEQIVASVEHAFPVRDDLDKLALAARQDESTRQIVEQVKRRLGLTAPPPPAADADDVAPAPAPTPVPVQ